MNARLDAPRAQRAGPKKTALVMTHKGREEMVFDARPCCNNEPKLSRKIAALLRLGEGLTWIYDGRQLIGSTLALSGRFLAFDASERILGSFRSHRAAADALFRVGRGAVS